MQLPPRDHLRGAVALINSRPGQLNSPCSKVLTHAVQNEVVGLDVCRNLRLANIGITDPDLNRIIPANSPNSQSLAIISTHLPDSWGAVGNGHFWPPESPSGMGGTFFKGPTLHYGRRNLTTLIQSARPRYETRHLEPHSPLKLETNTCIHNPRICPRSWTIQRPLRLLHRCLGSNNMELLPRLPNRHPKHHPKLSPHAPKPLPHHQPHCHRNLIHLNDPIPRHRHLRQRPIPPWQPDGIRTDEPVQSRVPRSRGPQNHACASADGAAGGRVFLAGVYGESVHFGVWLFG